MAEQKTFPKGIFGFAKKSTQPEWVLGSLVITPNELYEWLKGEGKQHLTEYKDKKQLKLSLTLTKDGKMSVSVDTWKPDPSKKSPAGHKEEAVTTDRNGIITPDDDLPF